MLITRGLIPLLAEGSARATDSDTTDEILASSIDYAKEASIPIWSGSRTGFASIVTEL